MSFKQAGRAVQKFILNYAKTTRNYQLLKAILDARRLNTTIQESDLGTEVGKNRQLKVSYFAPDCDPAAADCSNGLCDTGDPQPPKQVVLGITKCTASKVKQLAVSDVRDIDGNYSFSDIAKAQINTTLGSMRKVLAEEVAAVLIAHAGLQLDGNATRRLSFSNSTNGVVNPTGKWEIERTFENGGFMTPFVVGGTEVDNWKKATAVGGLSSNGINTAQLGDTNMYYDATVNSVYGDGGEHVLAFDPQVLKFVSYNRNLGMFATELKSPDDLDRLYRGGPTDYIKGVFLDPVTGLLWDFYLNFDKCIGEDGAFTYQFKLRWDILFMPDQVCNIQGVNGIFHFTTCAPVLAPCPTGDAVPAPVAATVRNWNPAFAYPFNVYQSNIGGTVSAHDTPIVLTSDADLVAYMNDNFGFPIFSLSGGNVRYTGNTNLGVSLNGGAVTGTFA